MSERARAIYELRAAIEESWKSLEGISDREHYRHIALDKDRITNIIKLELEDTIGGLVSAASSYFSNVMAIGYAGYLATWFLMKDTMSAHAATLIALLGFSSLVTFMLFEVGKMLINAARIGSKERIKQQIVDFTDLDTVLRNWNGSEERFNRMERMIWLPTFVISVATALGGASIMLWELCKALKW